MTGKREKFDLNHLIERCKAGEALKDLANECGVSDRTLYVWFGEAGFRAADCKRIDRHDIPTLYARHLAGESILALSKSEGVSRITLNRWFERFGLEYRNRSEGASVRMAALSPEGRRELTAAAQDARRGQIETVEIKARRALGRRDTRIGMFEVELIEKIRSFGFDVQGQYPVGPYNVDLALPELAVAVEIYSTHPSVPRMAQLRERTEYILDSGLHQLTVQCTYPNRIFDLDAVAYQVITFAHLSGGKFAEVRKQGVIRGDAKFIPAHGHYAHGRPVVEGL